MGLARPHAQAHRREALQVFGVRQVVFAERQRHQAQENASEREGWVNKFRLLNNHYSLLNEENEELNSVKDQDEVIEIQ